MALSLSQTAAVTKILKPGMRVASMGYPDLIAVMIDDWPELQYRKDSDAICKRHGLAYHPIPDAESWFSLMGAKLDVYDIVKERGCEIICDLNIESALFKTERYDVVLDVGTVEHCFNIANAIMNMADLVKEGGYIIHENPFSMGNHGFYNLNPTWYHDFYEANGFKLLNCHLTTRDGRVGEVPHTKRFRATSEEFNVFAMAQRTKIQSFVFPTQTKYQKLIAAAELPGERAADARAIGA